MKWSLYYGPRHGNVCLRAYAGLADSYRPAHPRGLVGVYAFRLHSLYTLLNLYSDTRRLWWDCAGAWARLGRRISGVLGDPFSLGAAQLIVLVISQFNSEMFYLACHVYVHSIIWISSLTICEFLCMPRCGPQIGNKLSCILYLV